MTYKCGTPLTVLSRLFITTKLFQLRDLWNPITFSFGTTALQEILHHFKLSNSLDLLQLSLEFQQLCGPPATTSLMEFDGIWRDLLLTDPIKTLFQCLRNYFLQHEQEIKDILNTTTTPPLPSKLEQFFSSPGTTLSISTLQ